MRKNIDLWVIIGTTIFIVLVIIGLSFYLYSNIDPDQVPKNRTPFVSKTNLGVAKFSTEEEFYSYLSDSRALVNNSYGREWSNAVSGQDLLEESPALDDTPPLSTDFKQAYSERYSTTNTQILSVDEADTVKTDGTNIYYSKEKLSLFNYWDDVYDSPSIQREPQANNGLTKIISALPPEDASLLSQIDVGGEMYLVDEMLIILNSDRIVAYDISDPAVPKAEWNISLGSNNPIITSRMYMDELYIIKNQYIQDQPTCPMPLYVEDGLGMSTMIECTDIYRPNQLIYSDSLITVLKLDPKDGGVKDTLSFLSNAYMSDVYMSGENLYITYQVGIDEYAIISDFITKNPVLFTQAIIERVEQLDQYDISSYSKLSELETVMGRYVLFMNDDEQSMFRNNLNNSFDTYINSAVRSLSTTGITKIDTKSLDIVASADIPGFLLNQFSLDEYEGYLRVATTVGGEIWSEWFQSSIENQNDIFIFDEDLDQIGSIEGLGLTESIYSARFIGEKAYIVTYRQIDPFYVIDLEDPNNPKMTGELKIPGYSSYLHPLSNDVIMGIGKEDGRVKVSLFDVKTPGNPIEVSKYALTDYWSEIESNHHAFLNDPKHQVVFLPGRTGGHIMSYKDNTLTLEKTVTGYTVDRAVYIDDYMYILSRQGVVVLDENSWETIKELSF